MKKGTFQIELMDLVDAVGGMDEVKRLHRNQEDVYTILGEANEDLMDGLSSMYAEVQEINWEELQDFCNSL